MIELMQSMSEGQFWAMMFLICCIIGPIVVMALGALFLGFLKTIL